MVGKKDSNHGVKENELSSDNGAEVFHRRWIKTFFSSQRRSKNYFGLFCPVIMVFIGVSQTIIFSSSIQEFVGGCIPFHVVNKMGSMVISNIVQQPLRE